MTASDSRAQPAPRGPKPSPGRNRDAVLEQPLRREAVGQLPPEVERALGRDVGENLAHALAAAAVRLDALGDRVLRPGQRRDPRLLHAARRSRRARGRRAGRAEPRSPRCRRRTRAASRPSRRSSTSRTSRRRPPSRPARRGSSAGRRPSKTMSPYAKSWMTSAPVWFPYSTAAAKVPSGTQTAHGLDGKLRKTAAMSSRGAASKSGAQPASRSSGTYPVAAPGQRRPGRVVGVVGVGEDDRLPTLGRDERELADRRLRPGHDRDLGVRVELDAVDVGVASRDRLPQRGQPPKRRVPVSRRLVRRLGERVDHVLRRPDLGVPAPEVDERLPVERGVLGDLRQERGEVLLREPVEPVGRRPHGPIV